MPEIRRDPFSGDWIFVAPDRTDRPHDLGRSHGGREQAPPRHDPGCPFCPGNEAQTPPAVLEYRDGRGEWQVRVVPNLFPLVAGRGEPTFRSAGRFFGTLDATGVHEVVVESPRHDATIETLAEHELGRVLRAFRERHRALRRESWLAMVLAFKNQGPAAGTSLVHPHAQIVGLPLVPPWAECRFDAAVSYHRVTGRCLGLDLLADEIRAGERVVEQADGFVVVAPYASRMPFEVQIAPRTAAPFWEADDGEIDRLARVLKRTLGRLSRTLEAVSLNYWIDAGPFGEEAARPWHWSVRIEPRLTTPGGFELGTGTDTSTVTPEEAAETLRRA